MGQTSTDKACFECRAADGRMVRLTRKRYESHILEEHADLAIDFAYPIGEIQKAVEAAEASRPGSWGETQEYVGPVVVPNGLAVGAGRSAKPRRLHVFVWKDDADCGHVITAYSVRA